MARNIVITGGTVGMGRAMADAFLANGDTVVVTDILDERGAQYIEEKAEEAAAGRTYYKHCHAGVNSEVQELVRFVNETIGGCDVLINNAGVFTMGQCHEETEENFDFQFNTNVKGVFLTSKYFLPQMLERKKGVIICMSSLAGLNGGYDMPIYCATKAAVANFVRSMALDYMEKGIRVNAICPTAALTPMFYACSTEKRKAVYSGINPSGHCVYPEDVAKTALWLASDDASFITGNCIQVDGGLGAWNGEPRRRWYEE